MTADLGNVIDKILDSSDTTVGGGAASALSGAMAAGMIGMVAKLSMKKPVNLDPEEYQKIAEDCGKLMQELKEGAVEDSRAYQGIVDAFRMPKDSEAEKDARRAAVQAAAIRAAEVPRDNAVKCDQVHALGARLKGNSNPACLSDLESALYLSEGAVKDCVLNIQANLSMIKDDGVISALKEDMLMLLLRVVCY